MKYILLLALLIRLPLLNQSLWLDESIEALAVMGRLGPIFSYALADYQPPLYHVIAYGLTQVLGYSEIVLRLPSLIAGIATVYVVAKIGNLLGGSKVGRIAGLLAATNPLLIYYAQEGRTYGMTTCFAAISIYFFLHLLQAKKSKRSHQVGYVLATACMIWTSYLSWFLLLAQGIYALTKKRYDLTLLQGISALTWVLWLPSFIASLKVGQYTLSTSDAWGRVVGGIEWKSLPLTWVKFGIGRISFDNNWLYGAIVMMLGMLHAYILRHSRLLSIGHRPLLVWLIPPVILGAITATILPVYSYFRVLFVLPAYLLLLAIGLSRLPWRYSIATLSLNLIFVSMFWWAPRFHREDWRSLTRDLQSDPSAMVAMPSHEQNPGLLYYGLDEGRIFEPQDELRDSKRIYYIRYAEDLFDAARVGPAKMEQAGYTITSQKVYTGIAVDVYENSD